MCLLGKPNLDGLFSLGKAATMGCCLSLPIRYEIVSLLGLILREKNILIRSPPTYLQIICSWEGRAASSLFQVHLTRALSCFSAQKNPPLRANRCTRQVPPDTQQKALGHISD